MKLNIVPARAGAQWVKLGLRTFSKRPLALTGLFFMIVAATTIFGLLPYVGNILALGLLPAATVGYWVATRAASEDKFPMPWILFTAFRSGQQELRAMLLLGLLYALCFFAILGASALLDGGQFALATLTGDEITVETMNRADFQSAALLVMTLSLPLSPLFWHAAALIHWHAVPPTKALFFGLIGIVRNLGAYIVMGLIWLSMTMGLMLLAAGSIAMIAGENAGEAAMVPVAVLAAALLLTTLYFSFADSFIATPTEADETSIT